MEGNFELGKQGWYTVKIVQPNDFLNAKLETDQYGIWYSVQFDGDANAHLWQAKTAPVAGEKVYGHLEKTASGKSTKFKRAKKDEIPQEQAAVPAQAPAPATPQQGKDWAKIDSDIRAQWAIGQAKDWALGNANDFAEIEAFAARFYQMVDRVKGGATVAGVKKVFNDDHDPEFSSMLQKGLEADGIDINDIPSGFGG